MAEDDGNKLRKAFLIGSMRNPALRAEEVTDRQRASADQAREADPKASVLGARLAIAGQNAVVSIGVLLVFVGLLIWLLGAGAGAFVLVAIGAVIAFAFSGSRR